MHKKIMIIMFFLTTINAMELVNDTKPIRTGVLFYTHDELLILTDLSTLAFYRTNEQQEIKKQRRDRVKNFFKSLKMKRSTTHE